MSQIYFIYDSFSPNNASSNRALAYMRALSKLRYTINVLFLMPDSSFSRITETLPGINVKYCWDSHYLNIRYFNTLSYIKYLWDIYRLVKTGDVVYLYGGVDLLRLLTHKKGVHVFHERTEHPLVYTPKGRLSHPSLNHYLDYCRKTDGIFVISSCLRDYFLKNGVLPSKVSIINSMVDFTRFDGVIKQSIPVPYFAYCGNGNNRKDKVNELIRVFAQVAGHYNHIHLYIIGPTKQAFEEEQDNVQLVHELGLDSRVIFTGMKNASEVPQLLVNATALFLTRPDTLQNRAGFSTKLSEYLASGNPVVTAGVGDIPLFLIDKENAFVYSPADFNAVKSAMEFILNNPEEAKRIGEAGRETARLHFNALIESQKLIDTLTNTHLIAE